jgi:hypothetical protein
MNAVALVGVVADERESRIAAPELAGGRANYAGAGPMNRVKFNLVQSLLQNPIPENCLP